MNCTVCNIPIQKFPKEYLDEQGTQIAPKYYRKENDTLIIFCSPHCGSKWYNEQRV